MAQRVLVLIGTRKGAFIAESNGARSTWRLRGPYCERRQTMDVAYDPLSGTVYAATAWSGGSGLFEGMAVKCPECGAEPYTFCTEGSDGTPRASLHATRREPAGIWRSTDLGQTWTFHSDGLRYADGEDPLLKVWKVQPTPHGTLYAGVEPAGLFRSDDGGATWRHIAGLRNHPSRPTWGPGNGGLCLHSIVVHPDDPSRLWVGTSAAGAFVTTDGGETWEPCNRNTRNFDEVNADNAVAGCIHKLHGALNGQDLLYQQNHFGVYRSFDAGQRWEEISTGLPSDFGFAMAIHPHDYRTIYVAPLSENRTMPEGKAAVWRSRDSGSTWTRCDRGLPQEGAHTGVLREGMAVDQLQPAGIYFGTNTGQVFGSADEGDTWSLVADYLPPVLSVEAAVVPD